EENLGTIAQSGSFDFKNENELKDGYDIIGQFGVGFYAAFMVADKVTVISRALESDQAYKWESEGADGYTIEPYTKESVGTEVILQLKENSDDDDYGKFLDASGLQTIIKKHSDLIRYPIKMDVIKCKPKSDDIDNDDYVDGVEGDTSNTMVPIWRKSK